MNNKNYRRIVSSPYNTAFTLVELMVTISIFLIITSVTIVNYSGFKSNVSLQNVTDDIALSIRKAQSYAIGAKGFGTTAGVDKVFTNSYGVHFSTLWGTGGDINGSIKSFVLFSNISGIYPPSQSGACTSANSCVELLTITGINRVWKISINGGAYTTGSLDIAFKRPEARATFCYRLNASDPCDSSMSSVGIVVWNGDSSNFKTKTITVQNTGQISVQ